MPVVEDLMKRQLKTAEIEMNVTDVARLMRDHDIGDVIVTRLGSIFGIVTDRDIAIRVTAEGKDPDKTSVGDICTKKVVTLSPDDDVDEALRLMKAKAVRRLPVVEADNAVGVVSLGDLAKEKDERSALADISSAAPNK